MLTATYSLVTISVEQENARSVLSKLQRYIDENANKESDIELVSAKFVLNKFTQFDRYCRSRKMELYLIPAVRNATDHADCLLAELESLSLRCMQILAAIRDQLRSAVRQGVVKAKELCGAMQLYCETIQQKLAKEDEELLPIAQRTLSIEEWFALAASFLSDSAENHQHKPIRRPMPRRVGPRADADIPTVWKSPLHPAPIFPSLSSGLYRLGARHDYRTKH